MKIGTSKDGIRYNETLTVVQRYVTIMVHQKRNDNNIPGNA